MNTQVIFTVNRMVLRELDRHERDLDARTITLGEGEYIIMPSDDDTPSGASSVALEVRS